MRDIFAQRAGSVAVHKLYKLLLLLAIAELQAAH
jgi:hypothetical protein